jgi:hypothetical protein
VDRSFCLQVSHWGTWGRGPFAGNIEKKWKEGPENGASIFAGALLGEPGGVKEGYGNRHIFIWRSCWENW